MNCSIYCLQDTHFQNIRESYLRAQSVYECVINQFTNTARGVAILFKADCEYKMVRIKRDNDDKVFILEIETMSYKIALVNIYGPR